MVSSIFSSCCGFFSYSRFEEKKPPIQTINYKNGDVYQGTIAKGLAHGEGEFIWANRDRYKGEFKDDQLHGEGEFTWANGDRYSGEFKDDQLHGEGEFIWANKNRYKGNFKEGRRHGEGELILANRNRYKGKFKDDRLHGEGEFIWANGDCYKGEFKDSLMHGEGEFIWANGDCYKGEFRGGLIGDKGELCFANGDVYAEETLSLSGKGIGLSNLLFLDLLIGRRPVPPLLDKKFVINFAIILADFLTKRGYDKLGSALKSASEIEKRKVDSIEAASQVVYEKLSGGSAQLLKYGCKDHLVGLNIIPDRANKSVIFELFNSGAGLELFHESANGKWQTQRTVKAPIECLTIDKVKQLLGYSNFKNIQEAYSVLGISGPDPVKPNLESAVLQNNQKTRNCVVEWMFAFCRNKMTKKAYDKMRIELFEECIQAIKDEGGNHIKAIRETLLEKIDKRKKRSFSLEENFETFTV